MSSRSVVNPASIFGKRCRRHLLASPAAEKPLVRFELHRPPKPSMERRVIWRDIGAPGAVAFFKTKRFQSAITRGDCHASRHQRIEHLADCRDGNMQFPPQFAHIGHPQRPQPVTGNDNLPGLTETKARIRHIGVGHRLNDLTRFWPHHRQRPPLFGNVCEPRIEPRLDVIGDPGKVMGAETGAGDDIEMILRQPRHRKIAFDAAARIQHLRIGELAHRPVHPVGANP